MALSIYEMIIDDCIERLAGTEEEPKNFGTIANFHIYKEAENDTDYRQLRASRDIGILSIALDSVKYGTESSKTSRVLLGSGAQVGDTYILVTCSSRSQWGETGAINYCHLVQRLLMGFKPRYSPKLEAFVIGLHSFKQGTWHYQVAFKIEVPIIPLDNFITEGVLFPGVVTEICFNSAPDEYPDNSFPVTLDTEIP